ncbi:hypothetical protein [Amycolatopsis thermoflava]|uniref:hypothetical protein n=1 Tax=Amycolatopsis thermoflava TaxID=84480 RepID=UPI00365DF3AF
MAEQRPEQVLICRSLGKLRRARTLRVHRRAADEEDLVLTTSSRAEQADEAASATTRLFLALMKHDDQIRSLVTEVVPEAFPWVRFLPREDVQAFVVELVDALEGAEALRNPAPVAQVITSWRHTAEAHADPELLAVLQCDGDDFGPVPAPGAADA